MRYSLNELEKRRKILKIFAVFSVFVLIIVSIDIRLRPIIKTVSENQAQRNCIAVIHSAAEELISENKMDYNSIVTVSRGENNNVSSVDVDMVKVNSFKSGFIKKVNEELAENSLNTFYIPIGTLTGSRFLNGMGPKIRVKILEYNCILADINSYFTEAGINQTLHRMVLHVEADVKLISAGKKSTARVSTDFLIGETLIVGKVPDAYTLIEEKPGDVAGLVNDYGAVLPE